MRHRMSTIRIESVLAVVVVVSFLSAPLGQALTNEKRCLGAFDLYFVLDRSDSVPEESFRQETVGFVEKVANNFKSPAVRLSFITFFGRSSADIPLQLTSDRQKIEAGLNHLRHLTTTGRTPVEKGLEKANEQIIRLGRKTASIVIVLTDGVFSNPQAAIQVAGTIKQLGAAIYAIGVGSFQLSQLESISSLPHKQYVLIAQNFKALKNIEDIISEKSCIEIVNVDKREICTGEQVDVVMIGRGFNKTENISDVMCGFRFNDSYREARKPRDVRGTRLTCPAPIIAETGRSVHLSVSVNGGQTFVASNVTVTASDCPSPSVEASTRRTRDLPLGLIFALLLLLLFLLLLLLWWFWPLIRKEAPAKYQQAQTEPSPLPTPSPTTLDATGAGKTKWPTVDASYYGGGGAGGITPVRVQWGDKGSTEAGAKLAKAKDGKLIDPLDKRGRSTRGGGAGAAGASEQGCWSAVKGKMTSCLASVSSGYHRLAAYRPRPGGKCFYSADPQPA